MNMKKNVFMAFSAGLFLCVFAGCASVQKDLTIAPEQTRGGENITEIESALIMMDANLYVSSSASASDTAELKRISSEIDSKLQEPFLDKTIESRLLSMKGRTMLLLGNKSEAKKLLSAAQKKYDSDVQCLILSRRLGDVSILTSPKYKTEPALTLEAALENFDKGEYDVACGLFDEAFLNSENFYREAYSSLRDRAWQLRNVDLTSADANFWALESITVLQMMEITQTGSSFLDYYTGGKKISSKQLFQFLEKAGLLKSLSREFEDEENQAQISDSTPVTRVIAARFLWNIYSNQKNIDSTKYSKRYRSRAKPKSLVSDVEISSEDFDAVLGVIENEIMSLVDGKNFDPEGLVSAASFSEFLQKMK